MFEELLSQFVSRMQDKFPNTMFGFEYNKEEKAYRVWHTSYKAEEESLFLTAMGELIHELFIPAKYTDYYFECDTTYSSKIFKAAEWLNTRQELNQPRVSWLVDALPINNPIEIKYFFNKVIRRPCAQLHRCDIKTDTRAKKIPSDDYKKAA